MTVPAAYAWKTNGDLIADVAKLGYLNGHGLDPTYGRGLWWTEFKPEMLATSDARDGIDFTDLPHKKEKFDFVAFDPPYVSVGGRKTSTIPDFLDRYGLYYAPKTPLDLQELINRGLNECERVLKPGGYLLVKTKDYISSGKLFASTHYTIVWANEWLLLELVDRFEHIGTPGPQPPGRRQVHARRNLSTLLVFQKPTNKGTN